MLHIGWSSRDVTPSRPAMLQGQMNLRIGTETMDPLTVTALAIADGDEQAVIVSCDIGYPSDGLIESVQAALRSSEDAPDPRRVILTATHTHQSLVIEDGFYAYPGGEVMSPAECEAWLSERIVGAIIEAWRDRAPHAVDHAFGHAVVGHNRHAVYDDGHAQMYGRTGVEDFRHFGGYEDHSLDMLFTWRTDGTLAGVAIAVPCPSQVTENLPSQFTADYWHETRTELRRRLGEGVQILALCGVAGDQSPHLLIYGEQERRMRERRVVSERQEIALRIADAVERALACTPAPTTDATPLGHVVRTLSLPPRQVSRAERDEAQRLRRAWIDSHGEGDSWWPARLQRVVDTFDGRHVPANYDAEIHVIRIGDLAIATNPFELFLDYGLQIKARSEAGQTMLVQLTGRGFYLPTQRAVDGGGYGAMPAVSVVGPEGGRQLVDRTVREINSLMTPAK